MMSLIGHKISRRQPLTDIELACALDYYNTLEKALSPCPVDYRLVLLDVREKLLLLNAIAKSRRQANPYTKTQHGHSISIVV